MINWWIAVQAASSSIAGALVGCALYDYTQRLKSRARKAEAQPAGGKSYCANTRERYEEEMHAMLDIARERIEKERAGAMTLPLFAQKTRSHASSAKARNVRCRFLEGLSKLPSNKELCHADIARFCGVSRSYVNNFMEISGVPYRKRGCEKIVCVSDVINALCKEGGVHEQ